MAEKALDDSRRNTSIAQYIWLPIRFEQQPDGTEMVRIDWKEKWSIGEQNA